MRPYFKSSIADLERLFDQVSSDRQGLQALASELDHRSTERAGILSRRVQTALDGLTPPLHKAVVAAPVSSEPFAPSVEPEPSARPTPKPAKPITNDAVDILQAWTALEVLSPRG